MAKAKTTAKKSTAKKSTTRKKSASQPQKLAQAYIGRLSDEATSIQKAGGMKTIPAKSVFKVNRADAVKKAAKTVK